MKHGNVKADYRHKHMKSLVCSIQNETRRGYKVLQMDTNTLKTKVVYYYDIDLSGDKGIWERIKEPAPSYPIIFRYLDQ